MDRAHLAPTKENRMPTFACPTLAMCRGIPATAVLAGAAMFAPAYARRSAVDPVVTAPPQLTGPVDSLVTVTVSDRVAR
jgi:hypothetical protein